MRIANICLLSQLKNTLTSIVTDHWYYMHPPRPVETVCAAETVEYAFEKVDAASAV